MSTLDGLSAEMQAMYGDSDHADFLVCAQILTQGTNNVNEGVERLCKFVNKLAELDKSECFEKYKTIIDYYGKYGTVRPLVMWLKNHKLSAKYLCALYKV